MYATKLKFEMYIKKLHYHQKASCVKTFKRRFFYFQNMDFTTANSKLLLSLINLCAI